MPGINQKQFIDWRIHKQITALKAASPLNDFDEPSLWPIMIQLRRLDMLATMDVFSLLEKKYDYDYVLTYIKLSIILRKILLEAHRTKSKEDVRQHYFGTRNTKDLLSHLTDGAAHQEAKPNRDKLKGFNADYDGNTAWPAPWYSRLWNAVKNIFR